MVGGGWGMELYYDHLLYHHMFISSYQIMLLAYEYPVYSIRAEYELTWKMMSAEQQVPECPLSQLHLQ